MSSDESVIRRRSWRVNRNRVPGTYRRIWKKILTTGVVDVYMTKEEQKRIRTKESREIIADWPASRVAAMVRNSDMTVTRLARLFGINRRTLGRLASGDWTPSPSLCLRFELIEQQSRNGTLHPEITPPKAEMRRRMILFRAWWFSRPANKQVLDLSIHIRMQWGKGNTQFIEIPCKMVPRMKLTRWEGIVDAIKAITKCVRGLSHGYGKMLWREIEQEYWDRYAKNTLPELFAKTSTRPNAGRPRKVGRPKKESNA